VLIEYKRVDHFRGEENTSSSFVCRKSESSTMTPSPTSPALPTAAGPATIAKSLQVKGEVICSDWLYIDGNVEGAISLAGGRVTVSRDAQVEANISAREVVVLGRVRGNINASDRVDIRGESSLIGDVTTQRISIGEGAFFKGSMEINKSARWIARPEGGSLP
jgi:cytoskeletal protein CcmA (bactofilin family)